MEYDIQSFVERLLEEKGILYLNLDELVLAEMRKDLVSRVENRINALIASNMPESAQAEFEKLIDSDVSDEDVQKFCSEKIPDLQSLIAADLVQFQSVYLGKR